MPKKNKLRLNDLNVTSFQTSEEIKGGDLLTSGPDCVLDTKDRYCSRVQQVCEAIKYTEGYEAVCKSVVTVDNIECRL